MLQGVKALLQGNRVSVVNSERVMVSGNKYEVIESYKSNWRYRSATNPIHGPFHPRRPDTIITRTISGNGSQEKAQRNTVL